MKIIRANESHRDYINENSLLHNTGFLAIEDEKIVGLLEYDIKNLKYAEIRNMKALNRQVLEGFIEEIEYWNPFIEKIILKDKREVAPSLLLDAGFIENQGVYSYRFKDPLAIFEINMDDIKIGQLTVSEDKVERVGKWVKSSQDIIVNLIELGGKMVCIDGNSRLVAGYKKGIERVFGYVSQEDDQDFYRESIAWCEADGVNHISDLNKRIVSQADHERIWIEKCQDYFNG